MDFSSQPQNVKIDIAWLGECWNILKSRMGEYIAMGLVAGVIGMVVYFVLRIPMEIVFGLSNPSSTEAMFGLLGMGLFVSLFATAISQGLTFVLSAGLMIYTLKLLRGEPARFEDLFIGFKNFGAYFIAGIIYGIGTTLAMYCCCIPYFFVAGALMFIAPLIYDRNLSAIEAIKTSFEILKPQFLMAAVYFLVSLLFAAVGFIACGIGILVTFPIFYIAPALAYHKIMGSPSGEAYLSPSGYPRDPSTMGNMPEAPTSWPGQDAPTPPSDPEPPTAPGPPANMDSDATTFENPTLGDEEPPADPNRTQ